MFSGLRTVVLWLIALAFPLQGWALVVVPLCPPSHHSGFSSPADRVERPAAEAPATSASANHATHGGMNHAASAEHFGDPQHEYSGQSGHDPLECCSVASSMVAMTTQSLAARAASSTTAPLQAGPFIRGVTLDALDRPPKRFLA